MEAVQAGFRMLDEEGRELYRKICKERKPSEAERPLYMFYAFYCSMLAGLLAEDPSYGAGEEAKSLLDAIIALAVQLEIPADSCDWG